MNLIRLSGTYPFERDDIYIETRYDRREVNMSRLPTSISMLGMVRNSLLVLVLLSNLNPYSERFDFAPNRQRSDDAVGHRGYPGSSLVQGRGI